MTVTGRPAETTPAAIESAGFVKLLARPDGDALAAAGILARALDARETPFQVSIGDRSERTERVATGDNTVTVTLGALADGATTDDATGDAAMSSADAPTSADGADDTPTSTDSVITLDPATGSLTEHAVALVDEIDAEPDPILGLAGTIAAHARPGDAEGAFAEYLEIARETGLLNQHPGVAIPTTDPVDGLAHSTLVRAKWSGDADAVAAAIGDAEGRQLASIVAIDAVGHERATERAAATVDRIVHPDATSGGPLATAGGLADVLTATARTSPVVGLALAIGHGGTDAPLDAWRTHGTAIHAALDAAETARHDGIFVLRLGEDAPELARKDAIESVADLAAATITPEPLVCVAGDGQVGLATTDEPITDHCEALADAHDLVADSGHRSATLRGDASLDVAAIVETARGRV